LQALRMVRAKGTDGYVVETVYDGEK
jgi:hypothetical protein